MNSFVPRGTKLFTLLSLFTLFFIANFQNVYLAYTYPALYAKSNLLFDADTGVIYISDNIDEELGIASLTKLMSVYVVLDEIKENNYSLDDTVIISEKVSQLKIQNEEMSGMYFNQNQVLTIKELLDLTLITSDNGAIIALSEKVSNTEEEHVKKMNDKATELGMNNTTFYNVTGLTMRDYGDYQLSNTTEDDYNISSARDMGILSYNLINDYPEVLEITSQPTLIYQGYEYTNSNNLVSNELYKYDGVKGLKTGNSIEAGECFISYLETEDTNYISVILNEPDDVGEDKFTETIKMYDWIDKQAFINLDLANEKYIEYDMKGDSLGKIKLYPKSNYKFLKSEKFYVTLSNVELNKKYFTKEGILKEDIPSGEVVASLTIKSLNDNIAFQSIENSDNAINIDLVVKEEVKKAGIIKNIGLSFKYFIDDLFVL